MSETQSTQSAASPAAVKKVLVISWVALGLAVLGFIFAIIPGISFVAWPVILAAFIVAIVALVKKGKQAVPVIALILSIVAGITAIVVSIVTALAVVAGAATEVSDNMTASSDEIQAGIGQTVTMEDGLEVTINSVDCGATTFEGGFGTETAAGKFCIVTFAVLNGGKEPAIFFLDDFGGLVGETEVQGVNSIGVGGFAPDNAPSIELNPGLETTGTVVIDIPADATLDAVTFGNILGEKIAIAAQ